MSKLPRYEFAVQTGFEFSVIHLVHWSYSRYYRLLAGIGSGLLVGSFHFEKIYWSKDYYYSHNII